MSASDSDARTDLDRSPSPDGDDEFDYGDPSPRPPQKRHGTSVLVPNQHHDEAVELSDDASVGTAPSPTPPDRHLAATNSAGASPGQSSRQTISQGGGGEYDDDSADDDDVDEGDETSQQARSVQPPALYNPADYKDLKVSSEILDLFDYIGRYKPQVMELDTPLAPFVPEYIPSVGDIDAFIKVPRPDGKPDGLGLVVLDEPGANQTDPTVLDLQLRVLSKQSTSATAVTVRSIENADKFPKNITAWITSIQDLHKQKPPPTVSYSRIMPDVDELMQPWAPDYEALINELGDPGTDLNLDLVNTAKLVCAILDIPVYNNLKESLHVLFTLYLEYKTQVAADPSKTAPGIDALDRAEAPIY
ncbi:unnamed protein product (mitochondrion) [Plasmodiophora brassicae]|uniref:Intraflagellar transport protein 46 homolog n=1 Tax=Plasmodiophora brassicae TaxID=37360 RepID=A0A3P3XZ78_PLABS|nr:unnamed protein product [Plasmodiophora brassicae]